MDIRFENAAPRKKRKIGSPQIHEREAQTRGKKGKTGGFGLQIERKKKKRKEICEN